MPCRRGALAPGDCHPPQRLLAARLGVGLTTVTRAYDEARRHHLLEGRGARGAYAAAPKVECTSNLDLGMNIPPPPEGVDFGDLLKQGASQVLMRADADLPPGRQQRADREAGARWLRPMLGDVEAGQVVVCSGAQAAITALILALMEPSRAMRSSRSPQPIPARWPQPLNSAGASWRWKRTGKGVPKVLEQACRPHRPGLVHLNPTLQNPTAITMPVRRRTGARHWPPSRCVARCTLSRTTPTGSWPLPRRRPSPRSLRKG